MMTRREKIEAIKLEKQKFEERMQKRRDQMNARLRLEEAKLATVERKRDTRRKVLLGAMLDEWMKEDLAMRPEVEKRLQRFLTRANDFAVFDMDPPVEQLSTATANVTKAEAESAA